MGFIRDPECRRNDKYDSKQFSTIFGPYSSSTPPNRGFSPPSGYSGSPTLDPSLSSTMMSVDKVKPVGDVSSNPRAEPGVRERPGITSTHRVQKASGIPYRKAKATPKRTLHQKEGTRDLSNIEAPKGSGQDLSQRPILPVPTDLCRIVIIQLNDQELSVCVSDLLYYFWTTSAITNCAICNGVFEDLAPPIRTISLSQANPPGEAFGTPCTSLTIRIHNRHLGCIRAAKTAFIPISQVWHQSIADAYASKVSSTEAIECLYSVISQVLSTVTAKFEPQHGQVELWHEYVSIPQWQRETQQSLLLMLPDIFSIAPVCLVHLDDVPAATIAAAAQFDGRATAATPSDQYAALMTFFHARWFEEVWVSLEYAYCNHACVYTMDGTIMCVNQGPQGHGSTDGSGLFSLLLERLEQKLRKLIADVGQNKFHELFKRDPILILGTLGDMRRNAKQYRAGLTFGEALNFVAGRKCRDYRDRFLAMCGFLNIGDYTQILPRIPKEPAQACLWLAHRCLERGDYSPLLLLWKDEFEVQGASWLTGHQSMSWNMWDLGASESPPQRRRIIQSDGCIYLELNCVGSLETFHTPPFRHSSPFSVFDYIISTILSHQGGVDAAAFLVTLERIYAVPESMRNPRTLVTLQEYLQIMPDFCQNLESLLTMYLEHYTDSNTRLDTCRKVLGILGFFDPLRGTFDHLSRLTLAASSPGASHHFDDVVGSIRCQFCAKAFLYRFFLQKGAGAGTQLYRIPGLGYSSSLPNGVGLLVSNKRVIGRMIYGTPACNCRVMERVEIT